MLVVAPLGVLKVAAPGTVVVKLMPVLQGPYPALLQVWIHHLCWPTPRVLTFATEQVPALQTVAAEYHWAKDCPEGSLRYR